MTDAQIIQILKFRYAQCMGNHRKTTFWPLAHHNPNCTLCHLNGRATPTSTCEHPYLKGLRIARHNKAVHLIIQTLQANKNTRYYTLTNACINNNKSPDQTIPQWLLRCTCLQPPCLCLAKLRPDILCLLGPLNNTPTQITPSPTITTQYIEFTYCHDIFIDQAIGHKHTKYDPLVNTIKITDGKLTHSSPSQPESEGLYMNTPSTNLPTSKSQNKPSKPS